MRTREQINAFWELTREGSGNGERVRRRITAMGAVAVVACGFLLAVGLGLLVVAFVAGLLASIALAALVVASPRLGSTARHLSRRTRSHAHGVAAWSVPRLRRGRAASAAGLKSVRSKAHGSGTAALATTRRRASAFTQVAVETGSRTGRELAETARSNAVRLAARRGHADAEREALRLNAAGTQHRRGRRYDAAVDCHRQALEILRTLDDRRAVALTQSNLALALSHSGDDEWSIGLFREAAETLHELGDDEHEAQIMANLGLAHRRHGRREEGDNVLELALSKLTPSSSAYAAIEEQLSRAS